MDEPSYYGFPTYGEDTVKAAQDCGGPAVTGDERSMVEDAVMRDRLGGFMASTFPGSGPASRSKRCLYTLTPDRDFVARSGCPRTSRWSWVSVRRTASSSSPAFGRRLTDLAVDGATAPDIGAFGLDRRALTDPSYEPNWMV